MTQEHDFDRKSAMSALRHDDPEGANAVAKAVAATKILDSGWDRWEAIGAAFAAIDAFCRRATNHTHKDQPYKKLYGALVRALPEFDGDHIDANNSAALRAIFISDPEYTTIARRYVDELKPHKRRVVTPRAVWMHIRPVPMADDRPESEATTRRRAERAAKLDLSLDPADPRQVNLDKIEMMIEAHDVTRVIGLKELRALIDDMLERFATQDGEWQAASPAPSELPAPLLAIEDASFSEVVPEPAPEPAPKRRMTRKPKAEPKAPRARKAKEVAA
jgi:predicted nucleic acid-binding protein